jgi:hypothetical protein
LDVLVDRCTPTAVVPSGDSSHVVVGLLEEVDADGHSEVLSAWVSDFEAATRVYESLLPRRTPADRRHPGWVFWSSRRELLWNDAAGQLVRISTNSLEATLLFATRASARRPLSRVVVLTSAERQVAEAARVSLEAAGFETAIREDPVTFEVQAGVFPDAETGRDRAEALRRRGFPEARVVQGGVEELAAGLDVSVLEAPGGERIVARHRRVGEDLFGEIWLQRDGEPERLLLPAFEAALPVSLVDDGR